MELIRGLRRLWRHRLFRRLLVVRIVTQSADGVLQVALASFVLFSPERQADAGSIAAVLAITLLPFSILGPFVGVVLDRVSRRQVLVVTDVARAVLALALAALVATGLHRFGLEAAFYGGVLLAMSLNRFLLAALSAALPHTIDPDEYLVANSVVPTVGPVGLLIGSGVGTVLRLLAGNRVSGYSADAFLFALAAAGYVASASLALRIPRDRLGPDEPEPTRARDVLAGLVVALRHLRQRRPAALGLLTLGAQRVVYGLVTVATILVYRNYFHTRTQINAAIAGLGVLAAVIGAGFVLAAVVTPPMATRIGIRRWMVLTLLASAVLQALPGAIYRQATLLTAAFLVGIAAQSLKISVDTLVQAHVADEVKGRVFVIYDMIFNVALVLAGAIAALVLPVDGKSVSLLLVLAVLYGVLGVAFAAASRGLPMDEGTQSLRGEELRRPAGS